MGTRHMIGVVLDGDFKVAQYGQWDGYPGGQGVDILNYLRHGNIPVLTENVRNVRWATQEDFDAANAAAGIPSDAAFINMEQAQTMEELYPQFSRNTSAAVLPLIEKGVVEFVKDDSEFALDSLFCEWAYVVDLDRGVLEAYEGFQKEAPKAGRWAGQHQKVDEGDSPRYYAVELKGEWPLNDLPSNDEFCAALSPEEYEDE